jgi:hypothetical protein
MVALFVRPRKSACKALKRGDFRMSDHGVATPQELSTEHKFVRRTNDGVLTDMMEMLSGSKATVIYDTRKFQIYNNL